MRRHGGFPWACEPGLGAKTDDVAGVLLHRRQRSWRCVIVTRTWAGCQASGGGLGVTGAPQTVTDDRGQSVTPNAILVRSPASVKTDKGLTFSTSGAAWQYTDVP